MSVSQRVSSDRQLARLLQIGVVLEEVVEARAARHFETLPSAERNELHEDVRELLEEAREESATVHLRKKKTTSVDTATALGGMIIAAQQALRDLENI